jgi:hypothetical protein
MNDMDIAKDILTKTNCSIVVIKNGTVLSRRRGDGIRPILETIKDLKEEIHDTIVGDRILGKASALLCKYCKVKGVYSPQATKTAIAVLIIAGIPCKIDEKIPYIKNKDGSDICPFEKMLSNIDSSEEAYKLLKEKVIIK